MVRRIPFASRYLSVSEALEGENRRLKEEVALLRAGILAHSHPSLEVERGPDGLPVPPPALRFQVAGTDDADWFLKGGELGALAIGEALASQGLRLAQFRNVLDFGCGCGRVIRHLASHDAVQLHGSDLNIEAIRWCDENLDFAEFGSNGAEPPLRYRQDSLDLVYAFSVFTHLAETIQLAWLSELHRVIRPGGILLLSVHGDACRDLMLELERRRYDDGWLVVRWEDKSGQNECAAFHPDSYVRRVMGREYEILSHLPVGAKGNPPQDLYVLKVSD